MAALSNVLAGIPGYAGYRAAQEAGDERVTGQLKQLAGAQGVLSAIAEEQRKRQAMEKQQNFEAAVAALGPNPTQEQIVAVAAQHATPDKALTVHQSSLDRQSALDVAKENRAAQLEQSRAAAEQTHQLRLAQAKGDEERRAETARHNRAMEVLQGQIAQLRASGADRPKPSPGYRYTADGNLEAIPGGPADLKLQGAFNQDTAALGGMTNSMDRLAAAANEAMKHPGLKSITGLRGMVPNVPGSAAADAQARLNTLKSQVGFSVLQDMRNNSKTGGALGSVSDAEGKRLEANLAALENAQSYGAMVESLQKIIDYTAEAKTRFRSAYNMKHGDKAPAAPTSPASPSVDSLLEKYK